jgi:23S rRNA (cytidine1920-2'-O)/16S rRNA (cytidine1409-2'-O)-methyltransferase
MKKRLDRVLCDQHPLWSRSYIQEIIHGGLVTVNGIVHTKSSYQVPESAVVATAVTQAQFVGRAGHKLDHALREFAISVQGLVAVDSGLSTGGFTDCLLQHGAQHVYGVDVGTAQVHPAIAQDSRVTVLEQTDLRDLVLDQPVDVVTLDLAFISVLKVMHAVSQLIKTGGFLIVLIKPQFEVGKENVGSQGVVHNEHIRDETVKKVIVGIEQHGFRFKKSTTSPIEGKIGNTEYLAFFIRS